MAKKIILKNGLRLVLAHQPESLAATALVLIEAGSEYEKENINGLSHFLEHMAFKGTAKRPKAGMISAELDSLGAEYNAFTDQEYTGYWAKVQSQKLLPVLDIVSDLYLNPLFNPGEIEKERGVIIEEINMYEDTPMRRVQSLFNSLLYNPQPAGWDILGKKEIIKRLKRDDFLKYRAEHYTAPATAVVVAGNFHEKKIIAILKELFGDLKRKGKGKKSKTRERQRRPGVLLKFKESDQSHLVLGTRAFNILDKRRYALQVAAEVLGGGMSSRLFHRIREEMGAAYYIRANTELSLDHGYLAVSAGVDNRRIKDVVGAILKEFNLLKKTPLGPAELQKAKDHLIGNFILSLESSDELAGFYGGQEILTRKLLSADEVIRKIQKVNAEEIQKIVHHTFTNGKLNLAVIGPYRKVGDFRKILKL